MGEDPRALREVEAAGAVSAAGGGPRREPAVVPLRGPWRSKARSAPFCVRPRGRRGPGAGAPTRAGAAPRGPLLPTRIRRADSLRGVGSVWPGRPLCRRGPRPTLALGAYHLCRHLGVVLCFPQGCASSQRAPCPLRGSQPPSPGCAAVASRGGAGAPPPSRRLFEAKHGATGGLASCAASSCGVPASPAPSGRARRQPENKGSDLPALRELWHPLGNVHAAPDRPQLALGDIPARHLSLNLGLQIRVLR